MKRTLFMLLSLVLVLMIASAATFLWLLHDQHWLKEQAQDYVTELTGRPFRIEGSLELSFSMHPTMKMEGMRLANTTWAEEAEMIRLERMRVSVDIRSLLSEQVVFDFIELDGLAIALEENGQGEVNWDLFSSKENAAEYKALMSDLPVRIDRLVLNEMHLSHEAPDRLEPLNFILAGLKVDRMADGQTNLTAHGSLGELPLDLKAHAGPLKHLVLGGAIEMQTHLSLGKIDLDVQGDVVNSHTGEGADLIINFSGPEFTWVTETLALPAFSQGAFDFDLKLESKGDVETLEISGDLGSLDIVANGEIDSFSNPREGQVKFELNGPDLQKLAAALGEPNLVPAPYHFQGDLSAHLGVVEIHSLAFEVGGTTGQVVGKIGVWPDLIDTELRLHISGPDLSQWGPALRVKGLRALPFSYSGYLVNKASNVLLTSNWLDVGDSHIELIGNLGLPPEFLGTSLDVDLHFPDLTKVTSLPGHNKLSPGSLSVQGNIVRKGQMLWLNNMKIGLDENRVSVNGQLSLSEDLLGSQLNGQAEIPNLASLGKYFQHEDLPHLPTRINVNLGLSASGLHFELKGSKLGDMVFDMQGTMPDPQSPNNISARFQLALPSLRNFSFYSDAKNLPDLPGNASGQVEYRHDQIRLNKVSGSIGTSNFDIDALLNVTEKFTGSHVKFKIAGPDFRPLLPIENLTALPCKFRASGRIELGKDRDLLQNLELNLGTIQARVNGSVDDLSNPTSAQLKASINLPSLSELDCFMDQDFPDFPFNMNASFTGRGSQFTLEPLQAKLGHSDLSGKISLDLRADPSIEGQLSSNFLDVAWLTKPDEGKKSVAKPAERVFPDVPIPPIGFGGLNMKMNLSAERLKLDFTELSGVKLDLSLHENYLKIDSFKFGGPMGERVSGKLEMGATEGVTQLDFKMTGDQLLLALATAENQDVSTFPQTDLAIDLNGKGVTYHELASSLNGQIRIVQGKGLIANDGLEFLFSDFLTELFVTLNPYARYTAYTVLECSVINAEIKSGEILINPLLFHTEQVTIHSEGNINLATEQIDMIFETKVRKGIGISMGIFVYPFIKLAGTLSSPSIELDLTGVVISGSVAFATYGLSLVAKSLYDRFLSSEDPCGEALKHLEKAEFKRR